MSIGAKHSYRFGYLKSDHWKAVRLEALAREKGKCQLCGEESIYNDAHHLWYPRNLYETVERQLVILCRPCHDFTHAMLPECKTADEEKGTEQWLKFKNAVLVWRRSKQQFLETGVPGSPSDLRHAYLELKRKIGSETPKPDVAVIVNALADLKKAVDELSKE